MGTTMVVVVEPIPTVTATDGCAVFLPNTMGTIMFDTAPWTSCFESMILCHLPHTPSRTLLRLPSPIQLSNQRWNQRSNLLLSQRCFQLLNRPCFLHLNQRRRLLPTLANSQRTS